LAALDSSSACCRYDLTASDSCGTLTCTYTRAGQQGQCLRG
jgi:hypothetical protein